MNSYQGARRRLVAPNGEPSPIHWRRGFFRVWLLLSAAWIMGWAIYLLLYEMRDGFNTPGEFLSIPVVLFGPPVALLLLGFAAAWAFRGFQVEPPPDA
jgi:hypothetical protein